MIEKNINILNDYLGNFPKVCLLKSYSKTDLDESAEYLSKALSIDRRDITTDISNDFILDLYSVVDSYIYTISLEELTLLKQNAILKFIEEPPINCYVLLFATESLQVLPTILTRSIIINLYKYNKSDLIDFISFSTPEAYTNLLLNISNSPDDISEFEKFNLVELYAFCDKIYNNLLKATLPNTLSIATKYIYINKVENGKYSLNVFLSMFGYYLVDKFKDTYEKVVYDLYMETTNLKNKVLNNTYNTNMLLENFLLNIWRIVRGELV